MPRDMDPNVFQFELTCLICQAVEHSQGNLKCHFNERGCRKFLISCGCCGTVYNSAHALASHLNARGAVTRDSFYPPGLAVSLDAAVTHYIHLLRLWSICLRRPILRLPHPPLSVVIRIVLRPPFRPFLFLRRPLFCLSLFLRRLPLCPVPALSVVIVR